MSTLELKDSSGSHPLSMTCASSRKRCGRSHVAAKPLRGFKGAGVLEVIENHDGDTYRTVYTVRFSEAVFVLHAFQKKSKRGIATPKRDIDLIRDRLEIARRLHESHPGSQKGRRR